MPRLYLPAAQITNNRISITGEKARYLVSVLRCRKGDDLVILDGEGNCIKSSIVSSGKKEVVAEVGEKMSCDAESTADIVLVQGLLKGEKMDLVIQKTTELGVKAIIPVITERSQVRETRKLARWRKIAEEASRQSGRSVAPVIHDPVELGSFLTLGVSGFTPHGFIFYEEGGTSLKDAIKMHDTGYKMHDTEIKSSQCHASCIMHHASLHILIGPEGGFTRAEIDLAKEKGLLVTTLGRRILRAETAAISAVTLVQFLLGDID